jgi:hypothetical protein
MLDFCSLQPYMYQFLIMMFGGSFGFTLAASVTFILDHIYIRKSKKIIAELIEE